MLSNFFVYNQYKRRVMVLAKQLCFKSLKVSCVRSIFRYSTVAHKKIILWCEFFRYSTKWDALKHYYLGFSTALSRYQAGVQEWEDWSTDVID